MKRWAGVVGTVGVTALVVIAGVQVYGLVNSVRDQAAAREFAVSACRGALSPNGVERSSDLTYDMWLTQLKEDVAQASRATRLDPSLAPLEQGLRLVLQVEEGDEWATNAPDAARRWDSITLYTNLNATVPAMEAVCKDLGEFPPGP